MPNVEFVYEQTCPFVRDARRRLIEGFRAASLMPRWTEWEVSDPHAPEYVRDLGSPTVLVDGRDISGAPREEVKNCCRIYALDGKANGVPPLEMIVAALTEGKDVSKSAPADRISSVRSHAALLPSVGLAALPKLTCPACWPAYAGLLSGLGVGFVNYTPYLLPLTGAFLSVSVLALAYRASRRHGYGPFLLGAFAALAVLIGKFSYDSDRAMWAGLGLLFVASVWNTWPESRGDGTAPDATCGVCT
ncbi:MAG: hypothetical protein O2944_03495 [Proteobacteria bacterium]|nr:hypothetical protein [Pseudomonadota bacterium]